MHLLAEPVLPGRDDVIEIVVPRFLTVGHEVAKLAVVDVIETCIKRIIVASRDPSPAEEAGRKAPTYQGAMSVPAWIAA